MKGLVYGALQVHRIRSYNLASQLHMQRLPTEESCQSELLFMNALWRCARA
jgi:hypothetical protein